MIPFQTSSAGTRGALPDALQAGLGSSQAGEPSSDAQAFARWMTQHSQAQQMPQALPQANAMVTQPSSPLTSNGKQAHALQGQDAKPAPPTGTAKASATDKPKTAVKQAQPKPPANPAQNHPPAQTSRSHNERSTPAHETKASTQANTEADKLHDGQRQTTPIEAAAWVQELQPPQALSNADPAAMLAWLASLTQADVLSATLDQAGATSSPQDSEASDGPSTGDAVDRTRTGHHGLVGLTGSGAQALAQASADAAASAQTDALGTLASTAQLAAAQATKPEAQASELQQSQPGSSQDFSALLLRESGRSSTPPAATGAHQTDSLAAPLDSPDFAQALADRVSVWVKGAPNTGAMTAQLRLNPAEMGPVQIRIELDGTNAQIDFAASQPETRTAIESSLSLLSSALEDAGLSMSGGGVSDQGSQQARPGPQGDAPASPWRQAQADESGDANDKGQPWSRTVPTHVNATGRGLAGGLDLYA